MRALRNPEHEILHFRARIVAASLFVLACLLLLAGRFVWLQFFKHDDFYARAESNRIAVVPVTANRGLIKDRNGVIIAKNYAGYTLEIATRFAQEHPGGANAVIDELAKVIDIQPRDRRRFKKLQEELKGADSIPIRTRLTDEEVARFAAHQYRFPGVELKARLFRHYPLGEVGSHLIGYIGRVSPADKERIATWPDAADYVGTEYIGKLGVERRSVPLDLGIHDLPTHAAEDDAAHGLHRAGFLDDLLAVLDRSGEDLRFVISCDGPYFGPMVHDPEAIATGNRFIYELIRAAPDRLYGSCTVNPHFLDASLRSMEQCFEHWGFVQLGEMLQYSMNYQLDSAAGERLE